MSDQVVVEEVLGQFATMTANGVQLFPTYDAAQTAGINFIQGAEFSAEADAYVAARGLTGKNAQGKINVIVDFLAFAATQSTVEVVADPF